MSAARLDAERAQRPLVAFSTPSGAPAWKRWLVFSPLARIAIFSVLAAALLFAAQLGFGWLGWTGRGAALTQVAAAFFLSLVLPALIAYLILVGAIEQRRPAELAWQHALQHGSAGTAAGIVLISVVVGVLWLLGSYRVVATNPQVPWVGALLIGGLASSIAEEIVLRGVLFRIAEEGLGTWFALFLSALVFGILHTGNPSATTWSSLAIALEAGILLGLVFHVWRSLPLCIGVHLGWNFAQGTLYGIPVSGAPSRGLLVAERIGPDWLSGGPFGVEASVVAVATTLLCSLALVALAMRRQTLVTPPFIRARTGTARQGAG